MKKPSIPATNSLPPELGRIIEPLKANVEIITGSRPGSVALSPLPAAATLPQVVTQLNLILSRIQQSG
jgi:hypothetical protein